MERTGQDGGKVHPKEKKIQNKGLSTLRTLTVYIFLIIVVTQLEGRVKTTALITTWVATEFEGTLSLHYITSLYVPLNV